MTGWQETLKLMGAVWLSPRRVVRRILDAGLPWFYLLPLVLVYGISFTMDQISFRNLADFFLLRDLLLFSLLIGVGVGPLFWMIYSALFYGLGRLFRGTGRWLEVQLAMAAAMVPDVAKLILWLMQLAVFREEAWTIWTPRIHFSFFLLLAYFFFLFLDAILMVWTVVIIAGALSEAHEFSLWKGFLLVLVGIPLVWVLFKYGLNIVLMPI
ncbi:Yip1 domain-containing protein [Planifilum fulgidum]|uniref:Yip1 domain-containing protein n=1 Tax=Planifilum fulgidum TaxID=201973 RepID=A0A1I2T5B1_9BACL|nr:YIP1 family protein [Planifilum fulgidum]SFG59998.1 Yip1 domain-containing protein [Planifilum fulgidum]